MTFASKRCPDFSKIWVWSSFGFPIQYSNSINKSTEEQFSKQHSAEQIPLQFARSKTQSQWTGSWTLAGEYALFHASCWALKPQTPCEPTVTASFLCSGFHEDASMAHTCI